MKNLKLFRFVFAVLVAALSSPFNHAETVDIPIAKDMQKAVQPISTQEEIEIGREVAANVIAQFGLYENEAVTEYVNMVGLTVAQVAPRKDLTYRFAVLNSDVVNAFAAPGGYIFITKGLLFLLKDEAQLASVLGHEIAHVNRKHVIKEIQKQRIANAAIPGYVKATAEKAELMSQITDLAIQMIWKGLSREDELEADKFGVEYAGGVGYQAASFKEVLEMMKARSESQNQDVAKTLKFLLGTHPKPQDRIQALEEKLKMLPPDGVRLEDRFKKAIKV